MGRKHPILSSRGTQLIPTFSGTWWRRLRRRWLRCRDENEVVYTGSGDSVRSKFLDCVAELASPSKGWDYVAATGLKESVDSIVIGLARNDGFHIAGGLQSTASHAKNSNTQYLDHLQKYLASATEESMNIRASCNECGMPQNEHI